ncbi:DUF6950 family protein [Rhizobium rhizogenes]|uniref:DUF6950 family protein n=1 Tax=Rhizobium rhizogenes TaxID=359 RepID=UPI001AEE2521|nr:hypothetical protein [Rhizobium rhizogenes]
MTLHEFLVLPHRFRWGGVGGDDCTTFCATWVDEQIGIDPAERLRGTYRDEAGAHKILVAAGGLVSFIDAHLTPFCYLRVSDPTDGDIGVVMAPAGVGGDLREVAAIRFGPMWAILSPGRVVTRKLDFIAAWRRQV